MMKIKLTFRKSNNFSSMKYLYSLALLVAISTFGNAQFKVIKPSQNVKQQSSMKLEKKLIDVPAYDIPLSEDFNYSKPMKFEISNSLEQKSMSPKFRKTDYNEFGIPQMVKTYNNTLAAGSSTQQVFSLLSTLEEAYKIKNAQENFRILSEDADDLGQQHFKVNQYANDIKVYDGQLSVHFYPNASQSILGRVIPNEQFVDLPQKPSITELEAQNVIIENLDHYQELGINAFGGLAFDQWKHELVYYNYDEVYSLVWFVDVHENMAETSRFFVDAKTGEIIHSFSTICNAHNHFHGEHGDIDAHSKSDCLADHKIESNTTALPGPETATAPDLLGVNRLINTYSVGSNYYLIDASREMYNAGASNMPEDPVGTVWTIDAFNTSPQNSDFKYDNVSTNNNNWNNNPTAVSAHFNAGEAYKYFKDVHSRNSLDGNDGNIISIINVTDENNNSMGNAFWNGLAMFYGNGDSAFKPLARALDVAGHEMSHGVVQNTANLEYQNESGAMNESFADIFGAMIDRDDWKVGEDVVKTNVFPSGALRDLKDPHNGASTNDFGAGWQPKHVDEAYTGSQDNGGVHLNSGIPNHAFYLYATAIGKDKAERVFYRALEKYLTKSSRFVDLRNAVEQAATDIFNSASAPEVDAAKTAFSQVGIGAGAGGDYEIEANENPGTDLVMCLNNDLDNLYILSLANIDVGMPLSASPVIESFEIISKPSISDNGSEVVFIGADKKMYYLFIDWGTGDVTSQTISNETIWRNVVISKDGNRVAALYDDTTNRVFVFDFDAGVGRDFDLYNPTFSEGVSTGDVRYADAMEFDISGQYVMYDAENRIEGSGGASVDYWDIGFIQVWDRSTNDYEGDVNNNVSKLFSALPEGVSVGNPSFSKNSPSILAFDLLEGNDFKVLGANLEQSITNEIILNNGLGYPNYSRSDNQMIYNFPNGGYRDLGRITLQSDKITGVSSSDEYFILDAEWGVWFANGERDLFVSTEDVKASSLVNIFPNPTDEVLNVETKDLSFETFKIFNAQGKMMKSGKLQNGNIDLKQLVAGNYYLKLTTGTTQVIKQFIKI